MNTGSHPAVDADIPQRRTHRARSAVAKRSPITLARFPAMAWIFECPMPSPRTLIGLNVLVWAVVGTWWFTTAPTLASLTA